MQLRGKSHRVTRGFTLLELLVVMAITVILMGLIFGPLLQSFNLVNRARVQVQVQDTARRGMEDLQRELANAVHVFDNTGQPINAWVPDASGNPLLMSLPYAQVDLVPPARQNDQNSAVAPGDIDPTTGLAINRGDIQLPLAPGRVIVRIWVGLRNNASMTDGALGDRPVRLYRNYYENPAGLSVTDHNPFLLYRATISPYLPNGVVDTRLFHVDSAMRPILYDPNFFYDNSEAATPTGLSSAQVGGWKDDNADGKVNVCENWRAIARPVVPPDRADEVLVERDSSRNPIYDNDPISGNLRMKLASQVLFQPMWVGNDAGAPASNADLANEAPGLAASTHVESYGHWTLPFRVFVFRSSLGDTVLKYFTWDGLAGGVRYQEYDTVAGALTLDEPANFDPLNPTVSPGTPPRMMFTVDRRRGLVNFAFPHYLTQAGQKKPIVFDPAVPNGEFDYVRTLPGYGLNSYRYVNLLALDANNPAGVDIALNPSGPSPIGVIPNAGIVPGSDVVWGPDMRPGSNYGRAIMYTRVPRTTDPKSLGPNEYILNYSDVPNANLSPTELDVRAKAMTTSIQRAGTLIFNSQSDAPGSPNSLPRLDADSNGVADVPVRASFQIQNNLRTDQVKADYLTRQMMNVRLGVRLFEFNSRQPQQYTLTQKVRIRNLQR